MSIPSFLFNILNIKFIRKFLSKSKYLGRNYAKYHFQMPPYEMLTVFSVGNCFLFLFKKYIGTLRYQLLSVYSRIFLSQIISVGLWLSESLQVFKKLTRFYKIAVISYRWWNFLIFMWKAFKGNISFYPMSVDCT